MWQQQAAKSWLMILHAILAGALLAGLLDTIARSQTDFRTWLVGIRTRDTSAEALWIPRPNLTETLP